MPSLKQTLALSTAGATLVTSNSFWFFESQESLPIQSDVSFEPRPEHSPNPAPEIQKPSTSINLSVNINGLTASSKKTRTGIISKDPDFKTGAFYKDNGVYFSLKGGEANKHYLSVIQSTQENFSLSHFPVTRDEYLKFKRETIKISLFTKPAWYSTTNQDEYSTELNKEQIEELFGDKDEAKVKQLLLSLHWKRHWMKQDNVTAYASFYSHTYYSTSLSHLSDIKIKYFSDFNSLKTYVHEKVDSCEGEVACFANPEELNFMDKDKRSFFESVWGADT